MCLSFTFRQETWKEFILIKIRICCVWTIFFRSTGLLCSLSPCIFCSLFRLMLLGVLLFVVFSFASDKVKYQNATWCKINLKTLSTSLSFPPTTDSFSPTRSSLISIVFYAVVATAILAGLYAIGYCSFAIHLAKMLIFTRLLRQRSLLLNVCYRNQHFSLMAAVGDFFFVRSFISIKRLCTPKDASNHFGNYFTYLKTRDKDEQRKKRSFRL